MIRKHHIIKGKVLKFNIYNYLLRKYNCTPKKYNIVIINNIIFNISSKEVSYFKDFLLYYDPNDFMRKMYFKKESISHLKYYTAFYEENNKIFPNYYVLPESQYLYWNIRQKQNIIINIENNNNNINKKRHSYSTIFTNSIKRSIYNESEFLSYSINSNGNDEIIKLIKNINENMSNISFSDKKETHLNNDLYHNLNKKETINIESERLCANNNLSSHHKLLLISKKKQKIFNEKNKNTNGNICLSDRIRYLNKMNKNIKHKRFLTNYNKELLNICENAKNNVEKGKSNKKHLQKEKIKKLVKTMKLFFRNNNKNTKSIFEIDNINNNNNNNNNNISKTSRNRILSNNIIKSLLHSININKKNNNKSVINQNENSSQFQLKINLEKDKKHNKVFNNIVTKKRKDNKICLNHIKTNSNLNLNLLSETISKTKTYYPLSANNNSISFNSPLLNKKLEKKMSSTESYTKLRMKMMRTTQYKLLVNNCLRNRRASNKIYENGNQSNYKILIDKETNKYFRNNNIMNDYSTQISFNHSKKQKQNNAKETISKTARKSKSKNKKESKLSLLIKNYKFKNINGIKDYHDSKQIKYGLKSRNNTSSLNSININLTGIKNLKISNNMYTTINIYGNFKNKNKLLKNDLKPERIFYKMQNDISCFDNKKLAKNINVLNDNKYINKKHHLKNNFSNNLVKKYHNKTNSCIYKDLTINNNKTMGNFNHLLNKNNNNKNKYISLTNNQNQKMKIKNIKPSLIKKVDKEYLYPRNSAIITTSYKNDFYKNKNSGNSNIINTKNIIFNSNSNNENKINITERKLSNNDKNKNIYTNSCISERNIPKIQNKIKKQNFKKLIENLNTERKEIDRNKLRAILNEKKILVNKNIHDN